MSSGFFLESLTVIGLIISPEYFLHLIPFPLFIIKTNPSADKIQIMFLGFTFNFSYSIRQTIYYVHVMDLIKEILVILQFLKNQSLISLSYISLNLVASPPPLPPPLLQSGENRAWNDRVITNPSLDVDTYARAIGQMELKIETFSEIFLKLKKNHLSRALLLDKTMVIKSPYL